MASRQPTARDALTYGNWRRPTSPGMAGLGLLSTVVLFAALIFVVVGVMVAGVLGGLAVLALTAPLFGLLNYRDAHHRTGLQRIGVRVGWWGTRALGKDFYRSGPLGFDARGQHRLPGLAAGSELREGRDPYGKPFALLHLPSTDHYTVVLRSRPDGASLVDQADVDRWVAHWATWLAALGNEPGLVGVSVTVESAPETGSQLKDEVHRRIDTTSPQLAQNMLREVAETYPEGSAKTGAWVALTYAAKQLVAGDDEGGPESVSRALARRLPNLGQLLAATGAGQVRAATAQELCEMVRVAYDPISALEFEEARLAGETQELSWDQVGPSATQSGWDSYRHDSGFSVSWTMSDAPRGVVYSSVLLNLLSPHPDIDRKRVTLLYRPLDPASAARVVEKDKNAAGTRARALNASERARADLEAATTVAQEQAHGAGLVNFGMIITATVEDEHRLHAVRQAVKNLAGTARLQIRPVYGSQDSAFAAALPLGLVLPKHLKFDERLRSSL